MKKPAVALLILFASAAHASSLPGIRAELLGSTIGFASSIAVDSHGNINYTTTGGDIVRFEGASSRILAHVDTDAISNSGLLGMALRDDDTAVVHYTTPNQTHEVISSIDLRSGAETILAKIACDASLPGRGTPPEHHGGNPALGDDGSIFVGIGDFGAAQIAQDPAWIAGKIIRIAPNGAVQQYARGFRNPFDIAWDREHQFLIVPDNGEAVDDEINLVIPAKNYGWPLTSGTRPVVDGDIPPAYVFPMTIAPTGLTQIRNESSYLRGGYLLGSFVTKAIYYIPDIGAQPLPDPIPLIERETGFIIDVAQAPDGGVYFTTGMAIYRLVMPQRGDCNGDGQLDITDLAAFLLEMNDAPERTIDAPYGAYRASWGCDANGDGWIDERDRAVLNSLLHLRIRTVR